VPYTSTRLHVPSEEVSVATGLIRYIVRITVYTN